MSVEQTTAPPQGTTDDAVAVVRAGYAGFNAADLEALTRVFAEGCSWHTPGRSPMAGDRAGRDAVFAHFGRYVGDTDGTFRAVLQTVGEAEDGRVIAIHHNTARRAGRRLEVDCCLVFEVARGRIVSGREHFFDLHAWDEFWS